MAARVPGFSRKSTMMAKPVMRVPRSTSVIAARHIFEMGAHGRFRAVGVARGNGIEDRPMRLKVSTSWPGASVVWRCSSSHSASAVWIAVKIGLRGTSAST